MSASSVWAVFSTFRPGDAALDAVSSVAEQVEGVIVVDDGSGPIAEAVLDRLESAGAIVVRRPDNDGIAAALNDGIARALDASFMNNNFLKLNYNRLCTASFLVTMAVALLISVYLCIQRRTERKERG